MLTFISTIMVLPEAITILSVGEGNPAGDQVEELLQLPEPNDRRVKLIPEACTQINVQKHATNCLIIIFLPLITVSFIYIYYYCPEAALQHDPTEHLDLPGL